MTKGSFSILWLGVLAGMSVATQAATVAVDFALDANAGVIPARAADSHTDFGDTWNFSDTVPLLDGGSLPVSGNTNAVVFGGMKAGWGTSTNYNPKFVIDRANERLQLQINSGNPPHSMEGMLLWNQAGFLNGMDSKQVVFDAESSMTVSFSAFNGTTRFAVQDGGTWYVSESTFPGTGTHTLNAPTSVRWAPVSTDGSYAIGSFDSRSLMDIRGVGIYLEMTSQNNQVNLKMEEFRMVAGVHDGAGSGYQEWAFSFPLSGGPYADDDGDGASNLKEFAQGGNPTNAANSGYPVESWAAEAGGATWLYFKHPYRPGVNSGIDYRLEVSGTLLEASWLQAGAQYVETVDDGFEAGLDAVVYRVPADQHDQRYARITADAVAAIPAPLANLDIFTQGYPLGMYFRYTEGKVGSVDYDTWATRYGYLDGMLGKMLDEEIYGRTTNSLPHYVQFKQDYTNQLALLHFNGNARDPRFDREAFAPQLFVHYVGCNSLDAISSAETVSVIEVEDTTCFLTNIGRDNEGTDNITICALDAEGLPDWTVHEETILLSIDAGNSTITVERGAFGSTPLAFPSNQAYLAAHDYEGPWSDGQILWAYNHTLKPPPDSNGKLLWEVLAEDLGNRFLPGGQLELIDGIEFDVLVDDRGATGGDGRKKDFDGDGVKDTVDVDGINTYGVGVIQFLARLREIMGPGKLIMADGHSSSKQRGFNILNGIESERFPNFGDDEIDEWSEGMNRHTFWLENCYPPAFNFIKYDPEVFLPNTHRLGYAAAVLTDTAISSAGEPRDGFNIHEWDEFRAGELNQWNWLGRPLGPVQHLAQQQPNLFQGLAVSSLITTSATKVDGPTGLELTESSGDITFTLDVPGHLQGEDLTIFITLSADPIAGYPATRNRLFELMEPVSNKVVMSWAGTKPFEGGFYFKDLNTAQLSAEIESSERLTLHSVTAHALPDICYRVFENGVVIANPSLDPFTFDAAALLPGMSLQHLEAHPNQDDTVNTGLPSGAQIQIPAKDAVFLIRLEAID
ncbi:hypothetical protein PDESU_01550 [Pontiella desulfatans]|uniref:Uncharacterized protein n=1 Tax=Pontiella desulfatans TaxID=2750659 RepID=A0A6C2U0S7_PONDE|nr:hypothetical protein [Pontiella desulfatans]VGO12996.1 hypothetical protein PDESU_01550 [Pontiella desulfatans]